MNTDQLQSIVRTMLKIVSGLLVAHGLGDTASIINAPDVTGTILLVASLLWSHWSHASTPPASSGGSSLGGKLPVLFTLGLSALLLSGCAGTPNKVAFQAAGVTKISVDAGLQIYDGIAAAGKTTPAQNLAVKNAWEKYHAAMLTAADAGRIASTSTNSMTAFSSAVDNLNQSKADLLALLASFGVTTK
jgi:hypothetical protein